MKDENVMNYQFRTQKTERKKTFITYFCSVIRYCVAGLSLFSDSEMKHAEWLRLFSFGNAIGSRPFSLGSVIGALVHSHNGERARRFALVHSHNGECATRLALVHSHNGEHALRLDEETAAETDDPAPGSATETGDVLFSGVRRQNTNAVHATHILHQQTQVKRCAGN